MKYVLNHFFQIYMAEAIMGDSHCQQSSGNVVLNLHMLEIKFTVNCGFFLFKYPFYSVGCFFLFNTAYKIVLAKCFQDIETW